jgi:phosphate starvation-inducible PhoH-like protein
VEAAKLLENQEGIAICTLTAADVVRHPLVLEIVEAYANKRR